MTHVILTAIGADRPGLVDEVSEFIFQRGGNIEDSRMVNLRGQFAMMVLIGAAEQTLSRLKSELWQLQQQSHLQIELRLASEARTASAQAIPYRLTATAIDQPGLVHRLSHLLRGAEVNIESLETHLKPAPITGTPMFEMELVISVPRSTSIARLKEQIAAMCGELNIDFELERV
ncbi:MAG TPA: ACT domain-containing protein [Tepidisphaeraceae bacterium]|jgi:glycine cleavage system transcriptional repressor|nr:ACT domain-containing protein [Tepidisphaeraceae bacterium]